MDETRATSCCIDDSEGARGGKRALGPTSPIQVRLKYKMGFEDFGRCYAPFQLLSPGNYTQFFGRTSDRGAFPFSSPSRSPLHPLLLPASLLARFSIFFFSFFLSAPIFPPFLPEPQNGAKIRYRFAGVRISGRSRALPISRAASAACKNI